MIKPSLSDSLKQVINRQTCHKIECLGEWLKLYSNSEKSASICLKLYGLASDYTCRETGALFKGLDRRLLEATKFNKYIFITQTSDTSANLYDMALKNERKIEVVNGNPILNKTLMAAIGSIPRTANTFSLIDAIGYRQLRFSIISRIANHSLDWQGNKSDMLLVLPLEMSLIRNLGRPECQDSITRFFGDDCWLEIRKGWCHSKLSTKEARNKLLELYTSKLKQLGYRYTATFKPTGFQTVLYYLLWASDRFDESPRLKEILSKTRYLPGELFDQS
jgi:three-Cys-motif partner protein